MAIKTIEYDVNIASLTPATEQFAGTQGDHRVTEAVFTISSELSDAIASVASDSKIMYRFDIYDGEGGIWSGEQRELTEQNVSIELEERHTRYGGKITVYLVITALSADNETEIELYSFPAVLRLKNKPEGTAKDSENYESLTALAEAARQKAGEAAQSADNAAHTVDEALARLEETAKITFGKSAYQVAVENGFEGTEGDWLASLKGEKGDIGPQGEQGIQGEQGEQGIQGVQGEKGEKGDAFTYDDLTDEQKSELKEGIEQCVADQTYSATSENAQSGVAVAEAIKLKMPKVAESDQSSPKAVIIKAGASLDMIDGELYPADSDYQHMVIDVNYDEAHSPLTPNALVARRYNTGNLWTGDPVVGEDCANKAYVDEAISDKVDKIDYTKKEQAKNEDYGYDTGVYGVKGNNTPALFHATKGATANTIAVRDGNGSISVSLNVKDSEGNNYVGGAAPHTWVQDSLNSLNERLYEFADTATQSISDEQYNREQADLVLENKFKDYTPTTDFNLLKSVVEGKKITKYTINGGDSLTLKKNAVYIFLRDGASNTVSLQYEGMNSELTFETGIVIIPDNTMGSSAQYPPSYYSLAIKISSGSLGIPDVSSAKFSVLKEVMESGGLVAKENSGSSTVSVWEIIL